MQLIANKLSRLILEHRYQEAQETAAELARTAVQHCNAKGDEATFALAVQTLRRLIRQLKAQQSHDATRLQLLNATQVYSQDDSQKSWELTA